MRNCCHSNIVTMRRQGEFIGSPPGVLFCLKEIETIAINITIDRVSHSQMRPAIFFFFFSSWLPAL